MTGMVTMITIIDDFHLIDNSDEAARADEAADIAETKAEIQALMREKQFEDSVNLAQYRYRIAKAAKTGESVTCPSCAKSFQKRSYQQAFCSNKGPSNCKDLYWNVTVPERLNRAKNFMPKG